MAISSYSSASCANPGRVSSSTRRQERMAACVVGLQPLGAGKSSARSSTAPLATISRRARSLAPTLLRFCHRAQGNSPLEKSSQSVIPIAQTSERWLNFEWATVSGAHQRVACGCLRTSLSAPSFSTTARPKSVTFTTVPAASCALKLQRRTLRQERSACTMWHDSRKTMARASPADAKSLWRGVRMAETRASPTAAFREPPSARSCTTSMLLPSLIAP
mmetsp:Transcript_571/g.2004  ORF Transcript_571/g.2004 Transcript_571/m.2004 type:complete len:219 (-) Transcript_571:348-1004(-)